MSAPLISVVTPFHNTARYLSECIESVLAQTRADFEYILVDNCSTDGSGDIAERYAQKDARIRFIRRPQLLAQVPNYNAALAEISPSSLYTKIVQADDKLFPECLRLMSQGFEQSEKIGLVSSYDLKGNTIRGNRFPYGTAPVSGRDVAALLLRDGIFVFGSPTTVMYRSSLVRAQVPFYREGLLHEDTEKCMEILAQWDFAFIPQVLSFVRTDNEGISNSVRNFQPGALDAHIIAQRFASQFLDAGEAAAIKSKIRREYYRVLAEGAIRMRGKQFWEYHKSGLKTVNETIDVPYLRKCILSELLHLTAHPFTTVKRALRLGAN